MSAPDTERGEPIEIAPRHSLRDDLDGTCNDDCPACADDADEVEVDDE